MNKPFTNLFAVFITLAVLCQSFFNSYVFGRDLPPETVSLSSIAILKSCFLFKHPVRSVTKLSYKFARSELLW